MSSSFWNSNPLISRPAAAAVSASVMPPSEINPTYCFDSLAALRGHLEKENIIDSSGLVLNPNIDIPLPDACQVRMDALLDINFPFYTRHTPVWLGNITTRELLANLRHLPVTMVGSAVWHVLGVDYIEAFLEKNKISITPNVKKDIKEILDLYHDVDFRVSCEATPQAFDVGRQLLAITLQAKTKNVSEKDVYTDIELQREAFNCKAFQKNHTVNQNLWVVGVGSENGHRDEFSFVKAKLSRNKLFFLDGVSLTVFDNLKITLDSCCPIQSGLDKIFALVRTDADENVETMGDLGTARLLSYLHLGYTVLDPTLLQKLLAIVVRDAPKGDALPSHLVDMLSHTIRNHLPNLPNGIIKLAFKASYELAKLLSPQEFSAFWTKVVLSNFHASPSYGEHEITDIAEKFANKLLAPIPFYHLLSLARSSLVKGFVHPLTLAEVESYCENPKPLLLAHSTFRLIKKEVNQLLFEAIKDSPMALTLWKKLEVHLSTEQKIAFAKDLPALIETTLEVQVKQTFSDQEAEKSQLAAASAANVPSKPKFVKKTANRNSKALPSPIILPLATPSPVSNNVPVIPPSIILVTPSPVLLEQPVVLKIEEAAQPILQKEPEKTAVVLNPAPTPQEIPAVLNLFTMKGSEAEFQNQFDNEAQICLDEVTHQPAQNASKLFTLLNFAEDHAESLSSHNLLAELLYLRTTLKDKAPKKCYNLDFLKVSSPQLSFKLLHQLNLLKYPYSKIDLSSTLDKLEFEIATDRALRTLLKDRKNITISLSSIYRWLDRSQHSNYHSDQKNWVTHLLANGNLLIPEKKLQKWILSLFSNENITSEEIHKLRLQAFSGSNRLVEFYAGYATRKDKSSVALKFEALKELADRQLINEAVSSFDERTAETLFESKPLVLLTPFIGDRASLQSYFDTLLTTCAKKHFDDINKNESLILEIYKFAREYAPLISSHDCYADFLISAAKLRKRLPKENSEINLAKVKNPTKRLEVISQLDFLNISYVANNDYLPLQDVLNTPDNDDRLRAHFTFCKKLPCSKESLFYWLDRLAHQNRIKELRKWLPIIQNYLGHLSNEQRLHSVFFKLLDDVTIDPKELFSFKKFLNLTSLSDLTPLFEHLIQRKDTAGIEGLYDLLLDLKDERLWVRAFQQRPCKELIAFVVYPFIEQSTYEAYLKCLLELDICHLDKLLVLQAFSTQKEKLANISTELKSTLIMWLVVLAQPSSLYIGTQMMLKLSSKPVSGSPIITEWLRSLMGLSVQDRTGLKQIVDQAATHLDLSFHEKTMLYIAFGNHEKLHQQLTNEFSKLDPKTKTFFLSNISVPHLDVLETCKAIITEESFRAYHGNNWIYVYRSWVQSCVKAFAEVVDPTELLTATKYIINLYRDCDAHLEIINHELFFSIIHLIESVAKTCTVDEIHHLILDFILIIHYHAQDRSTAKHNYLTICESMINSFKAKEIDTSTITIEIHEGIEIYQIKTLAYQMLSLLANLTKHVYRDEVMELFSVILAPNLKMLLPLHNRIESYFDVVESYLRFIRPEMTSLFTEHRERCANLLDYIRPNAPKAMMAKWEKYFEIESPQVLPKGLVESLQCMQLLKQQTENPPKTRRELIERRHVILQHLKTLPPNSGEIFDTVFKYFYQDDLIKIGTMEKRIKEEKPSYETLQLQQEYNEQDKQGTFRSLREFIDIMFTIKEPTLSILEYAYRLFVYTVPNSLYHGHEHQFFEKIEMAIANRKHWLQVKGTEYDSITRLIFLPTCEDVHIVLPVPNSLLTAFERRTIPLFINGAMHLYRAKLMNRWIRILIDERQTSLLEVILAKYKDLESLIWHDLPHEGAIAKGLLTKYFINFAHIAIASAATQASISAAALAAAEPAAAAAPTAAKRARRKKK